MSSTMPEGKSARLTDVHRGALRVMGTLEASGLAHTLADGRLLFRDVSFRVAAGSVVAIVGANGAGKTTLLRMLAGELTPTDGGVVGRAASA